MRPARFLLSTVGITSIRSFPMLMTIALVLLVLWVLGVVAFKVTAGVIHLVLVIAAIMLVMHFVRGRAPRA